MPPDLLVGVDLGSTAVKAGLLDVHGQLLGLSSKALPVSMSPEGAVEHDMDEVAETAFEVIAEAVSEAEPASVIGVGICGQGDGCWLVDRWCRPLRPAVSWRDARQVPSRGPTLPVSPGATIAVLGRLADREPQSLERASSVVFAKDWLRYRLTGEIATDPTDSASLRGALEAGWVPAELRSQAERLVPPVRASAEIAGHVVPTASAPTRLRVGTPVVTGSLDVAAAALGAGAVRVGDSVSILGTAGIHTRVTRASATAQGLLEIPYLVAGMGLAVMAQAAACPNVDWVLKVCWADGAEHEGGSECAFAEAARVPAGADGVIFHPYISQTGERAPFLLPSARAQLFGLDSHHSRAHILRAVLEGTCFATKECYDSLGGLGDYLSLAGAGARASLWCQVMADVVGTEVRVGASADAGLRGAAALAGVGVGLWPDICHAATSLSPEQVRYHPDAALAGLYAGLYDLYRDLRGALEPYWERRVAVREAMVGTGLRP